MNKPLINNRIRAREVRLIDDQGEQIGVIPIEKALEIAKEKNLDLIQITEKVIPPICKILDSGKYLYRLKKKEKKEVKTGEIKGVRLTFKISKHDSQTRMKQAVKFLNQGNKVKIEMSLRGRERGLTDFAKEKTEAFIQELQKQLPVKIERELKKEGRGFTAILSKQ